MRIYRIAEYNMVIDYRDKVYHASPLPNLEAIQNEGLVAGKTSRFEISNPVIYLALSPKDAEQYGGGGDLGTVVFEINVSDLNKNALFDDRNASISGWSYEYHENIPPSALSIFKVEPAKGVEPLSPEYKTGII